MPIGDLLAQITGEAPSPAPPKSNSIPKRKADDDLQRANDKQVRREENTANISRPISQIKRPVKLEVESDASKIKPRQNIATPSVISKVANPSTPAPNDSRSTTPATAGPSKPPKKGSFAEIMQRGKDAQATLGQIGKIQHKKIDKVLTKRERQEIREQNSRKPGSNGRPRPAGDKTVRDGQRVSQGNGKVSTKKSSQSSLPEKKIKKAALATTGYTGTARQNLASNRSSKPSSAHRPTGRDGTSSRRYQYASEEEDEEDEEEEYYSDASSDMEAAVFEVDEEEARAARIARKEDEQALAEENRHKREKEERRRTLAAMAAGRNKR